MTFDDFLQNEGVYSFDLDGMSPWSISRTATILQAPGSNPEGVSSFDPYEMTISQFTFHIKTYV